MEEKETYMVQKIEWAIKTGTILNKTYKIYNRWIIGEDKHLKYRNE